jgi:hypothetical protein
MLKIANNRRTVGYTKKHKCDDFCTSGPQTNLIPVSSSKECVNNMKINLYTNIPYELKYFLLFKINHTLQREKSKIINTNFTEYLDQIYLNTSSESGNM